MNHLQRFASAAAILLSLSACGGGSGESATTAPTDNAPTETVQGVTTPSSVSVVTAKNAQ